MTDLREGDVIRVRNIPGTHGKRFLVKTTDRGIVHAFEIEGALPGGKPLRGKLRSFSVMQVERA